MGSVLQLTQSHRSVLKPSRLLADSSVCGPQAGEQETFFEDPPGYPDGITAASDGTFWLAVISPRQPALESVLGSR